VRSSGPISLSLPAFSGVTRRLVLLNVGSFFGLLLLGWVSPRLAALLVGHLLLVPAAVVRGEIWQLVTYSFVNTGILWMLFGMVSLWFVGMLLESALGGRWLAEIYGVSVVGGALLGAAISFTHVFGLRPDLATLGVGSGLLGLMVAVGMLFGEQEFLFMFVLRMKAKYLAALYVLLEVAFLLKENDGFGALVQLSGALCGFLFVRFAPRRGLAFGVSERYFGLRNGYYRWKRRRAARKFEVYMKKQNRVVHFDKDGRYIDPDDARTKDPNDKRWMN
jgi:membrane associated rhomboid family serine protease